MEALKLCDDLAELGMEWVSLSGGEPTTRADLVQIVQRLVSNGVKANLITNGWLMDEKLLDKLIQVGINIIAVSIDGLEQTHDMIRKKGSFQRIIKTLALMKNRNVDPMVITTVNRKNVSELALLKNILISNGVRGWQLQIGFPMGNLAANREWVLKPSQIDEVIDIAHRTMLEKILEVAPGDNLGYYSLKHIELQKIYTGACLPQSCTAGKTTFGILHNGDITACTSNRDPNYIVGNIRERSLRDIWEDPVSFAWNRNITKEMMEGFCRTCRFGESCLGGCSNSKLTFGGSVYAENRYCSYNFSMHKTAETFSKIEDSNELLSLGREWTEQGLWQKAALVLEEAIRRGAENDKVLELYGFVSYKLGNFADSLKTNEKIIRNNPVNSYANKGMGLCLCRLNRSEEGITYLQKAIEYAEPDFMDPYHDLAVIYAENGQIDEALSVIERSRLLKPGFAGELYEQLLSRQSFRK
jgi:radical SAM protein with 4Fe4S-binding SPASM domain